MKHIARLDDHNSWQPDDDEIGGRAKIAVWCMALAFCIAFWGGVAALVWR